jgi:hypothetical protein
MKECRQGVNHRCRKRDHISRKNIAPVENYSSLCQNIDIWPTFSAAFVVFPCASSKILGKIPTTE